jgi:predicted dinucleotide-binding enzyme
VTDSVGIIGAGRLGQAMPRTALRAGRRVVIANSRGPESLASVISELGDGVSAQIHHPLTGLNLIQL